MRQHRIDSTPGWISRRFKAIEQRLDREAAARRIAGTYPNGIPSSALADPVAPGFVNLSATNFAVNLAGGYVINSTVAVPTGFTSCVLSLVGRVYAVNSTAADDYLYARAEAITTNGTALPVLVTANGTTGDAAVNVAPLSTVLTGLTEGGTFDVRLHAATATANWLANAANTADLTGSIVWFA